MALCGFSGRKSVVCLLWKGYPIVMLCAKEGAVMFCAKEEAFNAWKSLLGTSLQCCMHTKHIQYIICRS
jgi:hypothetical protein